MVWQTRLLRHEWDSVDSFFPLMIFLFSQFFEMTEEIGLSISIKNLFIILYFFIVFFKLLKY